MENSEDIQDKYGRWTIKGESHVERYPGGGTNKYYFVQCDCGTEAVIQWASLKNGTSKQCKKCRSMAPRKPRDPNEPPVSKVRKLFELLKP